MSVGNNISKLLSFVLRHKPEDYGISMDSEGWVLVEELVAKLNYHGHAISRSDIERVVENSDKKRFSLSGDANSIRANQGHSRQVDLGLKSVEPPVVLYHGTVGKFMESIKAQGLLRGEREYVHLSSTVETAVAVGARRGKPVVLEIRARDMFRDGYEFFISENGVWLTKSVPAAYIVFPFLLS